MPLWGSRWDGQLLPQSPEVCAGKALDAGSRRSALLQCSSGRSRQPTAERRDSASPSTQWVGSDEQRQCHAWVKTTRGESSPIP